MHNMTTSCSLQSLVPVWGFSSSSLVSPNTSIWRIRSFSFEWRFCWRFSFVLPDPGSLWECPHLHHTCLGLCNVQSATELINNMTSSSLMFHLYHMAFALYHQSSQIISVVCGHYSVAYMVLFMCRVTTVVHLLRSLFFTYQPYHCCQVSVGQS